ncbi:hypothetical protein BLA60_11230 [Actinophytocola xinjiangensis]|uniref:Hsp70 protein n=1 Tax=Actinophytocola xinjiangensis TaxID=485602 RepID=A0A7Z0WPF8_9PSEU|nr:Hsp70 family protein [Actinophytocola xinjiangensis]OLF11529.1 hypothetical protein BLA60_11230 [Actinophytocola xinjiangensis]
MPYALGIDLGSGRVTAAISRNDHERWLPPEVVPLDGDPAGVASVLHLTDEGAVEVGAAATAVLPTRAAWVARGVPDRVGDEIPVTLGGQPYPAEVLTAAVVGWVVDQVEAAERAPASQVVVTHPSSWGPHRRALLLGALREVDLPDPTLLPRPVAVAESHASTQRVEIGEHVAVLSLGATRCGTAVLRRGSFGFELRTHTDTDDDAAGNQFDDVLAEHVLSALTTAPRTNAMATLRAACTAAKERLSTEKSVSVSGVRVTRAEFEELIRPTVENAVESLRRTIRSTPDAQVATVVMAGASTHIPLVAELTAAATRARVVIDNPETSTARGAAVAASRVAKPTVRATAVTMAPEPIPRSAITHTDLLRLEDLPEEDLTDLGPPPPRPPVDIAPLDPPRRRLLGLLPPRAPAPPDTDDETPGPRSRKRTTDHLSSSDDEDRGISTRDGESDYFSALGERDRRTPPRRPPTHDNQPDQFPLPDNENRRTPSRRTFAGDDQDRRRTRSRQRAPSTADDQDLLARSRDDRTIEPELEPEPPLLTHNDFPGLDIEPPADAPEGPPHRPRAHYPDEPDLDLPATHPRRRRPPIPEPPTPQRHHPRSQHPHDPDPWDPTDPPEPPPLHRRPRDTSPQPTNEPPINTEAPDLADTTVHPSTPLDRPADPPLHNVTEPPIPHRRPAPDDPPPRHHRTPPTDPAPPHPRHHSTSPEQPRHPTVAARPADDSPPHTTRRHRTHHRTDTAAPSANHATDPDAPYPPHADHTPPLADTNHPDIDSPDRTHHPADTHTPSHTHHPADTHTPSHTHHPTDAHPTHHTDTPSHTQPNPHHPADTVAPDSAHSDHPHHTHHLADDPYGTPATDDPRRARYPSDAGEQRQARRTAGARGTRRTADAPEPSRHRQVDVDEGRHAVAPEPRRHRYRDPEDTVEPADRDGGHRR